MESSRSMRWRERRARFVQDDRPVARRGDLRVDVVPHATARGLLSENHYIRNYPAALLPCGVFLNGPGGRPKLVGAIVFSVPVSEKSGPKRTGLSNPRQSCDLGRLLLTDEMGANSETMALSQAFRLLRQERPEIESVVAYSDPMIRTNAAGEICHGGHVGQIYSCHSVPSCGPARYTGRTSPRRELMLPDGQFFSPRAASKVRADSQGSQYAIDQLVRAGAPRPGNRDPADWLEGLIAQGSLLKPFRHAGNHAWTFPLTESAAAAVDPLQVWPRPRRDPAPIGNDVTAPPLFAHAA